MSKQATMLYMDLKLPSLFFSSLLTFTLYYVFNLWVRKLSRDFSFLISNFHTCYSLASISCLCLPEICWNPSFCCCLPVPLVMNLFLLYLRLIACWDLRRGKVSAKALSTILPLAALCPTVNNESLKCSDWAFVSACFYSLSQCLGCIGCSKSRW